MSVIEGIGDEVTLLFGLLFLFILAYVVWLSTSVSDSPMIRVIVLDRNVFQQFLHRFLSRRGNQPNQPPATESENVPVATEETSSDRNKSPTTESTTEVTTSVESPQASSGNNNSDNTRDLDQQDNDTTIDDSHNPHVIHQSVLESFLHSTETITPSPSLECSAETSRASTICSSPNKDGDSTHSGSCLDGTNSTSDSAPTVENSTNDSPPCTNPDAQSDELLEGHIRIRLKYLNDDQRLVQARPEETIGHFKSTHFAVELGDNFGVRFIFQGRELKEDRTTLQAYNIEDNSVVHCLLTRVTNPEPSSNHQPQRGLDLGFLMLPIFAVILGLMWYCRFSYRNYFSAVSTLSLVGITFLFIVAILASWRHEEAHDHIE